MGISSSSARLAELSDTLHNARCISKFVEARRRKMNRGPLARIILAVIFVGLVISPWAIRRWQAHQDSLAANIDQQTALVRHGFYFQEVSHAAGINFVHQAPTLDHQLDHIMPEVASMGAAVSI